jgi:hypothetical protein
MWADTPRGNRAKRFHPRAAESKSGWTPKLPLTHSIAQNPKVIDWQVTRCMFVPECGTYLVTEMANLLK